MAKKNIIPVGQIQKGDRIKVTYMNRGMKETRTGIADHHHRHNVENWYDKDDVLFFTHLSSAVIELLDRPKPVIVLPTGEFAVISYERHNGQPWVGTLRDGHWHFIAKENFNVKDAYTFRKSPKEVESFITASGRHNHTVHFAGITK